MIERIGVVLEPGATSWSTRAVFNPAVIERNRKIYMFFRGVPLGYYRSMIGLAVSDDGKTFDVHEKPVIFPTEEYEKEGCEDPRIVNLEGRYFMTYVAVPENGRCVSVLAESSELSYFEKRGIITPEHTLDKDVVLFPEKINGEYVMLHRPHNWVKNEVFEENGTLYLWNGGYYIPWPKNIGEPCYFPRRPSIWIAFSNDLKHWYGHRVLLEPEEGWEYEKIGAGPPPVKTDYGWLLFYHGVSKQGKKRIYRMGAALLDETLNLIAKTKNPLLEPEEEYEVRGDFHDMEIVFPTGVVDFGEELYVYYGAGDKYIALAICNKKKVIKRLLEERSARVFS